MTGIKKQSKQKQYAHFFDSSWLPVPLHQNHPARIAHCKSPLLETEKETANMMNFTITPKYDIQILKVTIEICFPKNKNIHVPSLDWATLFFEPSWYS